MKKGFSYYIIIITFLGPSIIWTIFRFVYPLFDGIRLSFYKIVFEKGAAVYIFNGLNNWTYLLKDPWFSRAVHSTLYFTSADLVFGFVVGLFFALALNEDFRGKYFFRTLLILPWAVPAIVNGLVWSWIYNGQYGILNGILLKIGLINNPHVWLGDPTMAMNFVIFAQIWKDMPLITLLLLSSLQTIPPALFEQAKIDGASYLQSLRHITLPFLRMPIFFILLIHTLNSFKVFDVIYATTRGGPAGTTSVLYFYTYMTGWEFFNFGYASTLAVILLIILSIISSIYLIFFKLEI